MRCGWTTLCSHTNLLVQCLQMACNQTVKFRFCNSIFYDFRCVRLYCSHLLFNYRYGCPRMTERTFSSANRFNPRVFSRVHLPLPHTKCEMSVDIFHIVRPNLLLLIISKKFIFQYFQLIILFTSTSQAMARILELIIFLSVCQAVHTQSKIRWGKLLCDQVRYHDRTWDSCGVHL